MGGGWGRNHVVQLKFIYFFTTYSLWFGRHQRTDSKLPTAILQWLLSFGDIMPHRWVIWSQCCLEMSGSNYPLKEHNIQVECNPQLQCYENLKHVRFFNKCIYNKTWLNKTCCPLQNQVPAFPRQQLVLAFVRRIFVNTSSTKRTGLLNIMMLHVLPWHSITVALHCFITHVPQ